jgi:hypothetical protein
VQYTRTEDNAIFRHMLFHSPHRLRAWSVVASLAVHAVFFGAVAVSTLHMPNRAERLTDVVGELTLTIEPVERAATTPDPAPTQPEPQVEPEPEPPVVQESVEPTPQPEPVKQEISFVKPPPPPPRIDPPKPSLIADHEPLEGTGTQPAPPVPSPEPRASFAGVEASPARRVVYLVDASGAMTSSLKFVKEELVRSAARLNIDQRFQVIVFRQPVGSSGTSLVHFALSGSRPDLTPATREAKVALATWLAGVRPGGRSDPLPAIEHAMDMQPDLIFLLTRGINRSVGFDVDAHNRRVLDALERLNPRGMSGKRPARIKTVQFLDDDPTGLMQAIAEAHGDGPGSYRLVGRSEILQQARDGQAQGSGGAPSQ